MNGIPYMVLSITDRCNLNCPNCYKKEEMKAHNDMPLEEMKAIYDKFQPKMIQLFGGEPTLRWNDILEYIDYVYPRMVARGIDNIRGHSTKISIITNGTTGVDFNDIPKKYRDGINVSFSLDGFPESNDKNRGKGNYQKTHDAIKKCLEDDVKVHIISSIPVDFYINNIDSLQEFARYYEDELEVDSVAFATLFEPNTENTMKFFESNEYKKAVEIMKTIKNYKKCHHIPMVRGAGCRVETLYIRTDGQVTPKCTFFQHTIGHWKDFTIEDIKKINKYCNAMNLGCITTNFEGLDRYARRLRINK